MKNVGKHNSQGSLGRDAASYAIAFAVVVLGTVAEVKQVAGATEDTVVVKGSNDKGKFDVPKVSKEAVTVGSGRNRVVVYSEDAEGTKKDGYSRGSYSRVSLRNRTRIN